MSHDAQEGLPRVFSALTGLQNACPRNPANAHLRRAGFGLRKIAMLHKLVRKGCELRVLVFKEAEDVLHYDVLRAM